MAPFGIMALRCFSDVVDGLEYCEFRFVGTDVLEIQAKDMSADEPFTPKVRVFGSACTLSATPGFCRFFSASSSCDRLLQE
jgi:hypothetical protein